MGFPQGAVEGGGSEPLDKSRSRFSRVARNEGSCGRVGFHIHAASVDRAET